MIWYKQEMTWDFSLPLPVNWYCFAAVKFEDSKTVNRLWRYCTLWLILGIQWFIFVHLMFWVAKKNSWFPCLSTRVIQACPIHSCWNSEWGAEHQNKEGYLSDDMLITGCTCVKYSFCHFPRHILLNCVCVCLYIYQNVYMNCGDTCYKWHKSVYNCSNLNITFIFRA
jgi:hypothetical protein